MTLLLTLGNILSKEDVVDDDDPIRDWGQFDGGVDSCKCCCRSDMIG